MARGKGWRTEDKIEKGEEKKYGEKDTARRKTSAGMERGKREGQIIKRKRMEE